MHLHFVLTCHQAQTLRQAGSDEGQRRGAQQRERHGNAEHGSVLRSDGGAGRAVARQEKTIAHKTSIAMGTGTGRFRCVRCLAEIGSVFAPSEGPPRLARCVCGESIGARLANELLRADQSINKRRHARRRIYDKSRC